MSELVATRPCGSPCESSEPKMDHRKPSDSNTGQPTAPVQDEGDASTEASPSASGAPSSKYKPQGDDPSKPDVHRHESSSTEHGPTECETRRKPGSSQHPTNPAPDGRHPSVNAPAMGFVLAFKTALLSSVTNWLLAFIPVGFAVHFARMPAGVIFAMNAIAIVPLAGLLGHATESVASRFGDTVGALMNVTFGNAVEFIIFIIALVHNHIRIVQASLVGSILVNLLLILGMSFLLGGLRFREQVYSSSVAKISASLLALSVMSLLLPTAFHSSFSSETRADDKVLQVSRGTSVIVLLVYVLYLIFQLKSHSYIYAMPHETDESTAAPGPAAQYFHHTDSDTLVDSDSDMATRPQTPAGRVAQLLTGGKTTTQGVASENHSLPLAGSETESPAPESVMPALATAGDGNGSPSPEAPKNGAVKPSNSQEHKSKHNGQSTHRPEPKGYGRKARRVTVQDPKPSLEQDDRGTGEQSDFAAAPSLEAQAASPAAPGLTHAPSLTCRLVRRPPSSASTYASPSGPGIRRSKSEPDSRPSSGHRNFDPTMPPIIPSSVFRQPTSQSRPSRGSPNNNNNSHHDNNSNHNNNNTPISNDSPQPEPPQPPRPSPLPAITLLLLSTTLVALCAEFMVSSISALVAADAGLSEAFIGLVLLPLVGNAAEHATAVRVALKNKMDLAVGVAVGSSIQIALFVTPLVVILGWAIGRDVGLFFTLFETVCVFVSAFIVNLLVLDGRSNYLEGVLLCAAYVIVAVAAFFYPDVKAANELGGAD